MVAAVEGIGIASGSAVQQAVAVAATKDRRNKCQEQESASGNSKDITIGNCCIVQQAAVIETITVMQVSQGKEQKQQWNGRTSATQWCSISALVVRARKKANTLFLKKK